MVIQKWNKFYTIRKIIILNNILQIIDLIEQQLKDINCILIIKHEETRGFDQN